MPKPRSPNRNKAKDIYIENKGKIASVDIAEMLNISEGTIRGWKAKDRWDAILNGTFHSRNTERSVQNKKISTIENNEKNNLKESSDTAVPKTNTQNPKARFGNKNALGNKGGKGAAIRNKYAVKTHEFETIFFTDDIIDDTERALLYDDYDKYVQQYVLIKTLSVREKRILQDIKKIKDTPSGMILDSVTKNNSRIITEHKHRNKKGEEWDGDSTTVSEDSSSHVAHPVLKRVMALEEVLTRVQGRKQRAIEVLHRMKLDDERLAIDMAKLELYKQRLTGQIDLDNIIDGDDLGFDIDM